MKSIIATMLMTVLFLSVPGLLQRQAAKPAQVASQENVTVVTKTSAFPVKIAG
jgi:hypothetical protein